MKRVTLSVTLIALMLAACGGGGGGGSSQEATESSETLPLPATTRLRDFNTGDRLLYTVETQAAGVGVESYDQEVSYSRSALDCVGTPLTRLTVTTVTRQHGVELSRSTQSLLVSPDGAHYLERTGKCEEVLAMTAPLAVPSPMYEGASYASDGAVLSGDDPVGGLLGAIGVALSDHVSGTYVIGEPQVVEVNGQRIEALSFVVNETYTNAQSGEVFYTLQGVGYVHPEIGVVSIDETITQASGEVLRRKREFAEMLSF